jgi:large subunit ribosomal protein L30
MSSRVKVSLIRSLIGTKREHRLCVKALGLRKLNHTVELDFTPSVKGLISKVSYLLKYEAV